MDEKTIDLDELTQFCALMPEQCAYYAQAACVCLEKFGHQPGVKLKVQGDFDETFILTWKKLPSMAKVRWGNLEETVEFAAYAIAIMVVWKLTGYQNVGQAKRGTKVDFWLGEKSAGHLTEEIKGRLEVSGILEGTPGEINLRVKQKKLRAKSDKNKLTLIVVAEFSRPLVKMIKQ